MEITGERFHPSWTGCTAAEHYHRYSLASTMVANKDVLDIASGEGYGSYMLAKTARSVVGVDKSLVAIDHASKTYHRANLTFMRGNASEITLPESSFDVVTSFETLEHISKHDEMISGFRRVLKPDGFLLISTPNRLLYDATVDNEYHVKELDLQEFCDLLHRYFKNITVLGQRSMYGSVMTGTSVDTDVFIWDTLDNIHEVIDMRQYSMYYIAIASNTCLPSVNTSYLIYPEHLSNIATKLSYDLSEANSEISDLRDKLEYYKDYYLKFADLDKKYKEIVNSNSWKITSPLRKFRKVISNIVPSLAKKS